MVRDTRHCARRGLWFQQVSTRKHRAHGWMHVLQVLGANMNTEMWYEFAWDHMFFTATFKKAVGNSALLAPDIEALMPDPDRRVRLPHLFKQAGRPKKKRMRTRGEGADWRNQRRKAVPKCRYVLSCSFVEKAPGERSVGDAPTCLTCFLTALCTVGSYA